MTPLRSSDRLVLKTGNRYSSLLTGRRVRGSREGILLASITGKSPPGWRPDQPIEGDV